MKDVSKIDKDVTEKTDRIGKECRKLTELAESAKVKDVLKIDKDVTGKKKKKN